ncbi:MAG: MmgE/PrpD family protein [Deltaproteobacteria bacterium]|nr:MmgE/PrpD family protein [Deltaproteobacteria bacterium]
MDGNQLTARFIAETRWEDLPAEVQEKARMCLVDNLGATLAGTPTRVSHICADYAQATWPADKATILLHGQRASAVGAAFANAAAANGIDTDDGLIYAYGHGGAQIFPASLAVAEALDLNGERFLAGMVAGYEVAHRMGRCWHDDHDVYQACGSWGSVASAAAAANLMDLTEAQAWHALGISDYQAPNLPMMRDIDHPAMVKHGIHWGAMTGVMSAEMAARGFTGIPSLLGMEKYRDWTKDIGQHYIMVDGVGWKMKNYACCGWAHAGVEGAYDLVQENDIALDDIERIVVEAFHETVRLGTRLPATTEEAQFNLAWPVAAMLVDGEIGPDQTLEHRLSDPKIRDMAQKIEVVESDELNELCRLYRAGDPKGCFGSIVNIKLKDGREYTSGIKDGGMTVEAQEWTRETMAEKFCWLAETVMVPDKIDEILDMAWHLDEIDSVRELTEKKK